VYTIRGAAWTGTVVHRWPLPTSHNRRQQTETAIPRSATRSDLVKLYCAVVTHFGTRAFAVANSQAWNQLPVRIRAQETASSFKMALETHWVQIVQARCALVMTVSFYSALEIVGVLNPPYAISYWWLMVTMAVVNSGRLRDWFLIGVYVWHYTLTFSFIPYTYTFIIFHIQSHDVTPLSRPAHISIFPIRCCERKPPWPVVWHAAAFFVAPPPPLCSNFLSSFPYNGRITYCSRDILAYGASKSPFSPTDFVIADSLAEKRPYKYIRL